MNEDWRLLRGQEEYLKNVTLTFSDYKPRKNTNDHDHCVFCMAKFGKAADDLKKGYCTEDHDQWICPKCYEDFKEMFNWKLKK